MGFPVGQAITVRYYQGTSGVTLLCRIVDESDGVFGAELTMTENAALLAAGWPGFYETSFTPDAVGNWRALIKYGAIRVGQQFFRVGESDVPTADVVTNAQMRDVIGSKTDTAAGSITGTFSLMRYIKMLVTDWLNGGRLDVILDAIKTATDKLTGADTGASFSYLDAGGEQTVFTIAIGTRTKLSSLFLDLNTLTQNTTIRVKQQIDGANYRTFSKIKWLVATDDKGVYFLGELPVTENIQVTMEEVADEGAARAIPYYYITEAME